MQVMIHVHLAHPAQRHACQPSPGLLANLPTPPTATRTHRYLKSKIMSASVSRRSSGFGIMFGSSVTRAHGLTYRRGEAPPQTERAVRRKSIRLRLVRGCTAGRQRGTCAEETARDKHTGKGCSLHARARFLAGGA